MVMNLIKKGLLIVACLGLFLCTISNAAVHDVRGVSVACMMAYEEGGAPAVFSSPECPQWVLSSESSRNSTRNCQFATFQGHREYQEDRVVCDLDMKLPFSGKDVPEEVSIGIAAIFDGHGGKEASEMASKRLNDYFLMHVVFTTYNRALQINNETHEPHGIESSESSIRAILEEALRRTIQDIDLEFTKEAWNKGYGSGSTATVVLLMNGQYLIANVGDSKAILCSQKSHAEGDSSKEVYAEELTRDHHPDRADEKARIEAAGGFVRVYGVPRVNGMLAVSRAIGDVPLKRYGLIAEPEITGWRAFTPENSYLVVASDGIFETATPGDVCDILHDKASKSSLLAKLIVRHAFMTGSTDNLSAIVISDLHNATK